MDSGELITFLSSSVEDNKEITIYRTYSELLFDSVLCGFHVCKDIWSPVIREELNCNLEDESKHNRLAVAIYRNTLVDEFVVGHVQMNVK